MFSVTLLAGPHFVDTGVTQILTHTGHGRGFSAPVPLFFFWFSDGSRQHLTHGVRRLPLGLGGDVGVGVQGKPRRVMAQHP